MNNDLTKTAHMKCILTHQSSQNNPQTTLSILLKVTSIGLPDNIIRSKVQV